MSSPHVVSRDDWVAARKAFLIKEKEFSRARDVLSAQRRALPMVKLDKDYVFETPSGPRHLLDLFEGRRQLIVYHFMFDPDWDEGCPMCSFLTDNMPNPAHYDFREGDSIFHTYSTYARGLDLLDGTYNYLDLTPLGRQEEGPGAHEFFHHDRYGT
jgi:predicted dithiol-disulfide oxidoreductase (DUF899 family)